MDCSPVDHVADQARVAIKSALLAGLEQGSFYAKGRGRQRGTGEESAHRLVSDRMLASSGPLYFIVPVS